MKTAHLEGDAGTRRGLEGWTKARHLYSGSAPCQNELTGTEGLESWGPMGATPMALLKTLLCSKPGLGSVGNSEDICFWNPATTLQGSQVATRRGHPWMSDQQCQLRPQLAAPTHPPPNRLTKDLYKVRCYVTFAARETHAIRSTPVLKPPAYLEKETPAGSAFLFLEPLPGTRAGGKWAADFVEMRQRLVIDVYWVIWNGHC
nr:uncharacterized protein LOC105863217 [Microcebus murinus]